MPLYNIAGLTVAMQPQYELLMSRAERYRLHDDTYTPDLTVTGEGNEIEEYAAFARSFYEQLPLFDGFLLHASAVELDGKAVAFSAPSGTGKSTHAAFWRSRFGAEIINDDKPAVRLIDDTFCACGTPFSGKTDQSRNVCVPLVAIAFLERAEHTFVEKLPASAALWSLLNQTLRPKDAAQYDRLLTLVERLFAQIAVYRIGCTNDPSAAEIAKAGIKEF